MWFARLLSQTFLLGYSEGMCRTCRRKDCPPKRPKVGEWIRKSKAFSATINARSQGIARKFVSDFRCRETKSGRIGDRTCVQKTANPFQSGFWSLQRSGSTDPAWVMLKHTPVKFCPSHQNNAQPHFQRALWSLRPSHHLFQSKSSIACVCSQFCRALKSTATYLWACRCCKRT